MRTINECKAEIFRRGNEKKAKKAKQRKFLLSLVLPTFVSLTIICSLPLLIYPPSDEKGDRLFIFIIDDKQITDIGGNIMPR